MPPPRARGGTALERDQAAERYYGRVEQRLRQLEQGRDRGPNGSFGMPFSLVGPSGKWEFTEQGGSLKVSNVPINFVAPAGAQPTYNPSGDGTLVVGLNADLLDSRDGSYYLDYNNLTNKPDFDAVYVNVTGDTMTGDLIMEDAGLVLRETYGFTSEYTLSNSNQRFTIDLVSTDSSSPLTGTMLAIETDGTLVLNDKVVLSQADQYLDSMTGMFWYLGPEDDGYAYGDPTYGIYRTPGPWIDDELYDFQQMRINWPTGIQLGAGIGKSEALGPASFVDVISGLGLVVSSGQLVVNSGGHGSAATPFYLDWDGNFSIFDKLIFDSGKNSPDGFASLTVTGRIRGAIDNTPIVPTDSNTWYIGTVNVHQVADPSYLLLGDQASRLELGDDESKLLLGAAATFHKEATFQTVDTTGAAASHSFSVGETVVINGLPSPLTELNGAWEIIAKTASSFTIRSWPNAPFTTADGAYTAAQTTVSTTFSAASGEQRIAVSSSLGIAGGQYVSAAGVLVGTQVMYQDLITPSLVYVSSTISAPIPAGTPVKFYASARIRELTLGLHPAKNGSPAGYGLRLDENNYWFVNQHFRVGTTASYIDWNGSTLKTTGVIDALGGNFTGKMTVANGTMAFGARVDPLQLFHGLYVTANDYWYSTGKFSLGGVNGISYTPGGAVTVGTSVLIQGNISGGTIDIGMLDGTPASSFHVDAIGNMWLGSATFSGSYFNVSAAGIMYSQNSNIVAAYIDFCQIVHATIDAATINNASAVNLAVSGNSTFAGNITSTATITGGTIQTAASGNRIVMVGSTLTVYSPGGLSAGALRFDSAGGGWSGYIGSPTGIYINGEGQGGSSVHVGSSSVRQEVSINANTGTSARFYPGQIDLYSQTTVIKTSGNPWYTTSLFINANAAGGARAALGFDAGNGAGGSIVMVGGDARIHFSNLNADGYTRIVVAGTDIGSSALTKQDIQPWPAPVRALRPGDDVLTPALDIAKRIDVVKFRRREGLALKEQHTSAKGKVTTKIHHCSPETCGGTAEHPCHWRARWERGEIGVIAEQLQPVVPEIVGTDDKHKAQTVDYGQLAVISLAALKDLARLVEAQSARISVLEGV